MFRGRHDQARLHYPRLVDADGLSAAERARALSNYAFACALIGDTDTAATVLDRASHEAVQAGEPELEMRVLYHRGIALVESGRPLDAREPLLAAEAIAEQLERERAVAAIRDVRATALLYAGDAGAATQLHVESNRVDRAAGHEHGLVRGLVNEAFSRFADGDLDGALGCIAEGAHFAAQLQDVVAAANLRVLRANIAAARGELDNAVAELTSALDTLGSDEIDAKTCQLDLADVLVRLGRHDEAQAHVTTVLEAVGGVHGVAWLLAQPTLASLAAARGEHDVAADIVAATDKEYAARGFHWSVAEQRLAAARKTL
jgi:tetratricopeptide (TPR) repeat protein